MRHLENVSEKFKSLPRFYITFVLNNIPGNSLKKKEYTNTLSKF